MKNHAEITLTFIHAGLVEIFSESEWPRFIWRTFLLDTSSQLFHKSIDNDGEQTHGCFIIGNVGGLQKAAAGEFIKVIAGFNVRIHVFQNVCGYSNVIKITLCKIITLDISNQIRRFLFFVLSKLLWIKNGISKVCILAKYPRGVNIFFIIKNIGRYICYFPPNLTFF